MISLLREESHSLTKSLHLLEKRAEKSSSVGKKGLCKLEFAAQGGETRLVSQRTQMPLRVGKPMPFFQPKSGGGKGQGLYCTLLNPTGGVVGGDQLRTELSLSEGARVYCTTPAATCVYRSAGLFGEEEVQCRVEKGAYLTYFPEPTILFAGARYRTKLEVVVEAGGWCLFAHGFSAGRLARGERFLFDEFVSEVSVFLKEEPLFLERMRLCPKHFSLEGLVGTRGLGWVGSVVWVGGEEKQIQAVVAAWEGLFAVLSSHSSGPDEAPRPPSFLGAAQPLPPAGAVAVYLAASAQDFRALTRRLHDAVDQSLGLWPLEVRKQEWL